MSVTNLRNTVWEINLDNLPDSDAFFAYNVEVRRGGTTNAYSSYLKWVNAGEMDALGLWLSNNADNDATNGSQMFAVAFGIINFEYIEFGSEGTDLTNPNLINWLETHFMLISGGEEEQPTTPTRKFTRLYLGAVAITSNGRRWRKLQTTEYIEPSEPEQPALDGLFDADGVRLASWDTLVNEYGLDVETDYTTNTAETSSPSVILKKEEFNKEDVRLIIGNGVEKIGNNAFYNITTLYSVKMPDTVISIGEGAFGGLMMTSKTITIPKNVTSIGDTALGTGIDDIYINTNKLVALCTIEPFSGTSNIYFNAYGEDTEVLFDTTTFLGKGSSKTSRTHNVYTDNTVIKNASLSFVDQYTTVNVYKLDGGEW